MAETSINSSVGSTAHIQLVRLNTDKTRKIDGSFTGYRVYFELSQTPSTAWKNIFAREWSDVNPLQEAGIDGGFLVMHCPIEKVAFHLPVLKKVVAATNEAYKQYAQEQATEQERREDVWKDERKAVEDVAKSLHFE